MSKTKKSTPAKSTPAKSILAKYISNPEGDIYAVSDLPEEVIAVIFAYVSRSPKSFKENIAAVLKEEGRGRQRAEKFHEKWVLNYGHASVAEHASVHLGVEKVSRLFSSLLELCGEHLSFTEYSQRYQKPRARDFVVPPEIAGKKTLAREFLNVCARQYDIYEKLNAQILSHLIKTNPETSEKVLEKIAFEDARYALNLSAMTNLGMTANARAVEECLMKLLSSEYAEARMRAEEMKREVRFGVPTLVKYASPNPRLKETRAKLERFCSAVAPKKRTKTGDAPFVRLVDWTGKGARNPQTPALRAISAGLAYGSGLPQSSGINRLTLKQATALFTAAVSGLGKYDNPHDALKLVEYSAEFVISEACWHQLLRHRKAQWFAAAPSTAFGLTIPPNVKKARAEGLLIEAAELGESIYEKLNDAGEPQAAAYAVTNAHNRKVLGVFSLWELYHLINLRMSEGAQWDIREMTKLLADEVGKVHPLLVKPALKRI
ncbi:FAD-dependent thymidylate synthase [Candidatus Mycalebacterium sp.]